MENEDKNGTNGRWSFELYPERREERTSTWFEILSTQRGTEKLEKAKCENRVLNVAKKSPLIKLFLSALEKSGCPVNIERHVSCEVCDYSLLGGYDQELNQIVICQNVCTTEGRVQSSLSHELIHMFDYCNYKLDFKNLDHLACTEIKAANLTSCSYITALSLKTRDYFTVAEAHVECVKTKASWSIQKARNVSPLEARQAIERVFPKCYKDMEPLGLKPRRNSSDFMRAYRQRSLYGYG